MECIDVMIKDSDITAFLLIFEKHMFPAGDCEYISSDEYYTIVNGYNGVRRSSISKSVPDHEWQDEWIPREIHNKQDYYTEREALEIIVKHWLKNEHRS